MRGFQARHFPTTIMRVHVLPTHPGTEGPVQGHGKAQVWPACSSASSDHGPGLDALFSVGYEALGEGGGGDRVSLSLSACFAVVVRLFGCLFFRALFVFLFVCSFVHLFVRSFDCLFVFSCVVCLCFCLFVRSFFFFSYFFVRCLFVFLFVSSFVRSFVRLFVRLFVYSFVRLFVCLFAHVGLHAFLVTRPC